MARMLNVSVSPVSRGLKDHTSIGLVTRLRIQKLALQSGYEPNSRAIFLRKGRTMTIGVIAPELCDPFFSSAVNSIEKIADDYGYSVMLQSHGNTLLEKEHIAKMRRFRVDGLIVSLGKNTCDYDHLTPVIESGVPLVFLDSVPDLENVNYVTSDAFEAAFKAVVHLYGKGHRDIALLNGPQKLFECKKCFSGYTAAHKYLSLKPGANLVKNLRRAPDSLEKAIEQLLECRNRPTAIITFNDVSTIAVIMAQKNKTESFLEIVGFSNNPIVERFRYSDLTTINRFPSIKGERAAQILFGIINDVSEETFPKTYGQVFIEPAIIEKNYY